MIEAALIVAVVCGFVLLMYVLGLLAAIGRDLRGKVPEAADRRPLVGRYPNVKQWQIRALEDGRKVLRWLSGVSVAVVVVVVIAILFFAASVVVDVTGLREATASAPWWASALLLLQGFSLLKLMRIEKRLEQLEMVQSHKR
jgi:hypothetical protein